MAPVIVFGPTGSVGSVAARTAARHGATVWLAMRDPSKTISGLSAEEEKAGGYERVRADLTEPDSLSAAVRISGAKRAFVYRAQTQDHMKASLQALKSAGIEFVVFLSSFTIYAPVQDIPPSEVIPFVHARVEISLGEVFGKDAFVAVRPGAFATNLLRFKDGLVAGKAQVHGGEWEMDGITPTDMGEVSGIILATGPRDGRQVVYLYGPEIITQRQGLKRVAKLLGTEVEINEVDAEQAFNEMTQAGTPKPLAEYMVRIRSRSKEETARHRVQYEEGVKNVEKYTGHPAMSLEEWAERNLSLFIS